MTDSAGTPAPAPTVVVARRIVAGHEDAFAAWYERIRTASQTFPGHLRSELQPPDVTHPGEWVTIYSFETAAQLNAWLTSDRRAALIAEAAHLVDGPAREQRVAGLGPAPNPVTVVFSQRIAPRNHRAFESLQRDAVTILRGFRGFLAADVFPPASDIQDDHVLVASFASRPDLDRWLESDERRDWLARAEALIEGERTVNVVGGFGGWFPTVPSRSQGPKLWKQAVAVLIALFPTALLLTWARNELLPDLNFVLGVLIGNVVAVAILTYLLMPRLNRLLARWLRR